MNELALEDSNGTLIGVSRIRNDEKRGFFADDCVRFMQGMAANTVDLTVTLPAV